MPVYQNPETKATQALSEEAAALYPYLVKVADESNDERDERERREFVMEAEANKVDVTDDDEDLGRHAADADVDPNQDGV